MGSKGIVLLIIFVVIAVGTPFMVMRTLKLGDYAESPQTVTLTLGASALVAGGKAKIWYAGGDSLGDFEVRCDGESRYFSPLDEEGALAACGIEVELLEVEEPDNKPPRAKFNVVWED